MSAPTQALLDIRLEQLGHLYRNAPKGLVTNLALAILFGLILRDHVDDETLVLWLATTGAIVLARALSIYLYERRGRRTVYAPLWQHVFLAGAVLQGAVWGFSVWIFGPFSSIELPVLISFTLGGLTAGAAALMGSLLVVYLSYLFVMTVPLCVWFFQRGDEASLIMGGMLLFYIGVAISVGITYSRTFLGTITLTNELVEAREQAEAANRAKTRFISSMGHELRTPLTAILGFTQLLKLDTEQAPHNHGHLDEIGMAGNHLLRLINDLLDMAKVEAGQIELTREVVDVSQLIHESLAMITPLAAKYEVTLAEEPHGTQRYGVVGDFLRLKQVLLNLLSNGCKYNRKNGVLRVCAEEQAGPAVRITVHDTGYGIPLNRQQEIFQTYNRIGYENSGIEGTGIGLTIAKMLVEKMGGRIGFESRPGAGSAFWLELPLIGV